MPNKLSIAESHVLESIQDAAFDVPGVLPAARGLSHLGEHALGWMRGTWGQFGQAAPGGVDSDRCRGVYRARGKRGAQAHRAAQAARLFLRARWGQNPLAPILPVLACYLHHGLFGGPVPPDGVQGTACGSAGDDGIAYGARGALSNRYRCGRSHWRCYRAGNDEGKDA